MQPNTAQCSVLQSKTPQYSPDDPSTVQCSPSPCKPCQPCHPATPVTFVRLVYVVTPNFLFRNRIVYNSLVFIFGSLILKDNGGGGGGVHFPLYQRSLYSFYNYVQSLVAKPLLVQATAEQLESSFEITEGRRLQLLTRGRGRLFVKLIIGVSEKFIALLTFIYICSSNIWNDV